MLLDELLQLAVERLAEDEALRGELTDEGYGPLLDWAIAAAEQVIRSAPPAQAESAINSATDQLRRLLREASRAAVRADPRELLGLLGPPVFSPDEARRIAARLRARRLGPDRDENARHLAHTLAGDG